MRSALTASKTDFLKTSVNRWILVITLILTFVYFYAITFAFPIGALWIFVPLILGEIFHVYQVVMYIQTVWNTDYTPPKDESYAPPVDVFITVVSEPVDIVEETVIAAKNMRYPNHAVYILNDGFVAKKDNWEDFEVLAKKHGIGCITRQVGDGAKAGNINNAVKQTGAEKGSELVVIFDADHVPHEDFLEKTVPYFSDAEVAFVQSPQYYKNHNFNHITQSSWEQQELFFGPICKGKNAHNCATMCGTNMVIRRKMLIAVGGMAEESIAEDFLTGIRLHANGWKSVYVPEVLAEGLAPEDFLSYVKQQFRWARGALDVIFGQNLIFKKGLTFTQRMQYLASISFYFSGLIVAMNALIPLVYFFFGEVPLTVSTMSLALIFLPYIFLTLYVLQRSSNYTFTFRALVFSMGAFWIHIKAMWAALSRQKSAFAVTPKRQQTGNFINLVIPHIIYVALVPIGIVWAYVRDGFEASLIANAAWALLNAGIFVPFIYAALPSAGIPFRKQYRKLAVVGAKQASLADTTS